jgi:hypothetical protein
VDVNFTPDFCNSNGDPTRFSQRHNIDPSNRRKANTHGQIANTQKMEVDYFFI